MRILVFCPYYPPHTGGLETHSDEFNKYLAQQGTDIVVFTPHIPETASARETRYSRVNIVRYPAFEIIPNYPVPKLWSPEFWKDFNGLFRSDFDVIISRTRFFLSSLFALLYAKLKHKHWIHIEHGSDFVKLSSPFKSLMAKIYDYTFGTLIFRCSDINVSISRAVQSFVKKFDRRTSPVIYRGIDFESIDMVSPDETLKQKYAGKTILCTAARLYKWKGIELTIEAIGALSKEVRDKIIFLILGDGEDFSRLKKLASGLPIEMLGNLPREKVIAILKASDMYIHSSLPGGGLSTSLLEAMYCGCAVIATKNEGADEIVHNNINGILVQNVSPHEIKEVVTFLLMQPNLCKNLSKQAHLDVQDHFDWLKSCDVYYTLLQSYVRNHH